jgi:hypothetical protein
MTGRATAKVAALLASISLLAGAQLLVPAPAGAQEKAAFDAYVICLMASRASGSRADPHAHKLSARQRKASRTTKGRHVGRSTRPSHATR